MRRWGGKMIGGRLTHLLADALLIPGSHQGEKWRFVGLESDWCNSTWMNSIKSCVYLCKQAHQGCLALHLFISADIWYIVIIISSYTCVFTAEPFQSDNVVCVNLQILFFLKILNVKNEAVDCCGRSFSRRQMTAQDVRMHGEGRGQIRQQINHGAYLAMPQDVVNVLISKLSPADGWVHKQTV